MPKVSVIIPMYNVEKYISRCADSLFSQDYFDMEYIFINDGSPDKSEQILLLTLNKYPARKEQVKIIHHSHNRGLAAARNTGIDAARGDFLMWCDADDWMEPGAVKTLVEEQVRTEADIVSGSAYQVLKTGKSPFLTPHYKTREAMIDYVLIPFFNHVVWIHLMRRSIFIEHNIRTKEGCNQGEDMWIMMRVAYYAKSVSTIDRFVYNYNCTNEASQCAEYSIRANVNKYRQDMESVLFVVDFFKDKEQKWNDAAHKLAIIYIRMYLFYSAKYSLPAFHAEMCKLAKNEYKDYYSTVSWDNPLRKTLYFNYSLLSIFTKTRSFVWRKIVQPLLFMKR